jgi:hypothetical protein
MPISVGKLFDSPICEVEFAGFRSDTYTLQRAGWQISAEQVPSEGRIRLALKFAPAQLYAMTSTVSYTDMMYFNSPNYRREAAPIVFRVQWMSTSPRIEIMSQPVGGFRFEAIDCEPMLANREVKSMDELIPFRPISTEAPELIIAPDRVAEVLDMILKCQDPRQAEIREAQRRQSWKDAQDSGKFGHNPTKDIKAQIIAIAG